METSLKVLLIDAATSFYRIPRYQGRILISFILF